MKVPLLVVNCEGPSLFGRDWLTKIRLNWGVINAVKCRTLTSVLERYSSVFEPGLGTLHGYEAKIYVDPGAHPKYCKARSVPYAMRGKVEEELERLVSEGIIKPVQFADWAAPIVPVVKRDGKSLRICGDFKLTVNIFPSIEPAKSTHNHVQGRVGQHHGCRGAVGGDGRLC